MAKSKTSGSFIQDKMNIVIRTDASIHIGTGHVFRCLTLADELTQRGMNIRFICREEKGNLIETIKRKGYKVYLLPAGIDLNNEKKLIQKILEQESPDWLIIDHYDIGISWETYFRKFVKMVMVIDDLANRPHDCDLLLDQNLYENLETRYDGLVPTHCIKLLGPRYALLRQEFRNIRKNLRERNGKINRIFISFGGIDPTKETTKVLQAVQLLNRHDILVDVVVGTYNPHKEQIRQLCFSISNINFYCQIDNMAELMASADLAIGAGGVTTWERCCLGLPSIVTILSDNQYELTLVVEKYGAIINMGWGHNLTMEDYLEVINNINIQHLSEMSTNGMNLVDGEGGLRVTQKILSVIGRDLSYEKNKDR